VEHVRQKNRMSQPHTALVSHRLAVQHRAMHAALERSSVLNVGSELWSKWRSWDVCGALNRQYSNRSRPRTFWFIWTQVLGATSSLPSACFKTSSACFSTTRQVAFPDSSLDTSAAGSVSVGAAAAAMMRQSAQFLRGRTDCARHVLL